MFNVVSNLYQVDSRRGDKLLEPQRWCRKQWGYLFTPLTASENKWAQVAKRIVQVAFLILPTAVAYVLGVCGIVIKACVPATLDPSSSVQVPLIPDLQNEEANSSNHGVARRQGEVLEEPIDANIEEVRTVARVNPSSKIFELSKDVVIYALAFLETQDHLNCIRVCKTFKGWAESPILWESHLSHPDRRIWGATQWNFTYRGGAYCYQQEVSSCFNGMVLQDPLEQLKTYHLLKKRGEAGSSNTFFDYLARLIIGGPIAFNAFPRLSGVQDATQLQANQMTEAVVIGKDGSDRLFLALRLKDTSNLEARPFALVFVVKKLSQENSNDLCWEQVANPHWAKGQLNMAEQTHLNYILHLIRKEDLMETETGLNPLLKQNMVLV